MLRNLFTRTPAPVTSAANPGRAVELRFTPPGAKESRLQVVTLLAEVLRAKGIGAKERAAWLELPDGLVLLPRIVGVEQKTAGHWLTHTTVEAVHPRLFPQGVFEYQHSGGADVAQAIGDGLHQFAAIDLPVLQEAVSGEVRECSIIRMERDQPTLHLPQARRVVLGPVAWQAVNPAPVEEAHSFCPCCFFTHTRAAMTAQLRVPDFCAIRVFAARYPDDGIVADCRVNGIDWEEGKQALLAYAATWPDRGFETRRQYLVIHTPR